MGFSMPKISAPAIAKAVTKAVTPAVKAAVKAVAPVKKAVTPAKSVGAIINPGGSGIKGLGASISKLGAAGTKAAIVKSAKGAVTGNPFPAAKEVVRAVSPTAGNYLDNKLSPHSISAGANVFMRKSAEPAHAPGATGNGLPQMNPTTGKVENGTTMSKMTSAISGNDPNAPAAPGSAAAIQNAPGYSMTDMPTPGDYQGLGTIGAKGVLTPKTMDANGRMDMSGLDAVRARATQVGPSAWMKMGLDKQGIEQAGQMDAASQGAMSQLADSKNMVARSGGLRGGASERLAAKSGDSMLAAQQGVLRQGSLDRANLGVEDERQKLDMMKTLPGADLSVAQYKSGIDSKNMDAMNTAGQYNVQNSINDLGNQNNWAGKAYEEKMKLKGALATADSMRANNNSSGGFFS